MGCNSHLHKYCDLYSINHQANYLKFHYCYFMHFGCCYLELQGHISLFTQITVLATRCLYFTIFSSHHKSRNAVAVEEVITNNFWPGKIYVHLQRSSLHSPNGKVASQNCFYKVFFQRTKSL